VPVNGAGKMRQIIDREMENFPKYGHVEYSIRSRLNKATSEWSEPVVACYSELNEVKQGGDVKEVSPGEKFTFSVFKSRFMSGAIV